MEEERDHEKQDETTVPIGDVETARKQGKQYVAIVFVIHLACLTFSLFYLAYISLVVAPPFHIQRNMASGKIVSAPTVHNSAGSNLDPGHGYVSLRDMHAYLATVDMRIDYDNRMRFCFVGPN